MKRAALCRTALALIMAVAAPCAAEPFAHVGRRQTTSRELLLKGGVGQVLLRVGEGGIEIGLRNVEVQGTRLRKEDVLENEIVEEAQFGRQGLFF